MSLIKEWSILYKSLSSSLDAHNFFGISKKWQELNNHSIPLIIIKGIQHLVMWIVLMIIEITNYDSPVSQLLSLAVRILQPVTAMNRIPQLDKLMK